MIMVVFVHAYTLDSGGYMGAITADKNYNTFIQDFISQGLARVASPLFFIISGYLMFKGFKPERSDILLRYKKRIRTLLIPFLLWSGYGIGLYFVLQLVPQLRPHFTNHIIANLSVSQLIVTWLIDPIPYQLWFLRDLIALALFSPVIWFLVKYMKVKFMVLALAAWLADLDLLFFTSGSLLFFTVGCHIALKSKLLAKLQTNYEYRLPLFCWLGVLIFKTELAYFGYADAVTLMLLHKMAILIGIYALWVTVNTLADQATVSSRQWLHTSISSFFIYTFHEPLLTILKKGILYLLQASNDLTSLLVYLFAPVCTILLCILVAGVLKRYVPPFFHLITGNRELHSHKIVITQAPQPQPLVTEKSRELGVTL
jgi:surface polysaccharide O-acyltransferase-like enzyme